MVLRGLAKAKNFTLGPTAPMKSFSEHIDPRIKTKEVINKFDKNHQLTDIFKNKKLYDYEIKTKKSFDDIVSTLKEIAYIQHNENFLKNALQISQKNAVRQLRCRPFPKQSAQRQVPISRPRKIS